MSNASLLGSKIQYIYTSDTETPALQDEVHLKY